MDIKTAEAWKSLIGEVAMWVLLFGFLWAVFIRRSDD